MPTQTVNNIDLYYEVAGAGQPVLFIHGLGSSTRDWERQTPFFSQQFQVITFDVRGHGRSQKPPGPYSVPLFARDTAGLIEALGVGPAPVVGISMGGMIALQLAVDRPDLVKSLVVVNAGPELVVRTRKDRWQIFLRFLIARLGMRRMGQVLSERLFPKAEQADIRSQFVARWAENDQRAYIDAMRALVGWSVTEHLAHITCPTLVVAGDEDYTPVAAKEAYVAKMPQAELLVIEDSRHATPIDQSQAFNEAVLAFLQRQA